MKKNLILFCVLFFIAFSSIKAATITVPAGTTVYISGWVGDNYIVEGTLTSASDLQMGGSLTIKPGGKVIVATTFSAYGKAITIEAGGELNASSLAVQGTVANPFEVSGKVTISGSASLGYYFQLKSSGLFSAAYIDFTNPNNTIEGVLTATHSVRFHNGPNTMNCPGQIITEVFSNYSGPNPISGSGYIEVHDIFDSNNSLTTSSDTLAF